MKFPVKSCHFESGEDMHSNVAIVPSKNDFRKMMSNGVLRCEVDVAVQVQTLDDLHNFIRTRI